MLKYIFDENQRSIIRFFICITTIAQNQKLEDCTKYSALKRDDKHNKKISSLSYECISRSVRNHK
ncbi:hypothetical protein D9V66_00400 [Buchnera aphidicola (Brevicoryne brassicae)]|uniref:hypothetical protein n=1 Tax=Buchnera aphidicola TaxID=9 RepID=UPI0010C2B605|nr:hypothetical protein [Buchnera aphidicola]QCI19660.1 hypothetical protein D9V66_00400 [Buchnera aphidicola (Brevicoryne brassicae)]